MLYKRNSCQLNWIFKSCSVWSPKCSCPVNYPLYLLPVRNTLFFLSHLPWKLWWGCQARWPSRGLSRFFFSSILPACHCFGTGVILSLRFFPNLWIFWQWNSYENIIIYLLILLKLALCANFMSYLDVLYRYYSGIFCISLLQPCTPLNYRYLTHKISWKSHIILPFYLCIFSN